jgi:hypothetical protein
MIDDKWTKTYPKKKKKLDFFSPREDEEKRKH